MKKLTCKNGIANCLTLVYDIKYCDIYWTDEEKLPKFEREGVSYDRAAD